MVAVQTESIRLFETRAQDNGVDIITLSEDLAHYDEESFSERLSRLRFLEELIEDSDWHFTPLVVVHLFEEAKLCFLNGAFSATIILCRLICEEMLKQPFRNIGEEKDVELNFGELIRKSQERGMEDEFLLATLDRTIFREK